MVKTRWRRWFPSRGPSCSVSSPRPQVWRGVFVMVRIVYVRAKDAQHIRVNGVTKAERAASPGDRPPTLMPARESRRQDLDCRAFAPIDARHARDGTTLGTRS